MSFVSRMGKLAIAACTLCFAQVGPAQAEIAKGISVDVVTGTPIHLLLVGHEKEFGFQFQNTAKSPAQFTFSAKLTSYDGATLEVKEFPVSLKGGETKTVPSPVTPTQLGHYYIDYQIRPAKGDVQKARIAFAYLAPAGPRPWQPDVFHFCITGGISGTQNDADRDRETLMTSLCGMDTERTCIQFGEVEPQKGVWDEKIIKRFDENLNYVTQHGLTVEFLLCYNAQWDAPTEKQHTGNRLDWLFSAPDPAEWAKYCHMMAARFGDRIKYWEMWNEPDIVEFWTGTEDQYLAILKSGHDAIKEVDPNAQVMSAGFATLMPHGGRHIFNFMADVCQKGQADFDILAFHQHGDFATFKQVVDHPLQEIRDSLHPAKPLYYTETAAARYEGDTIPVNLVWEKIVYGWANGAMAHTWYCLRAGTIDGTIRKEHQWGLYTEDWYPTPTYVSYNTLVSVLKDKRFVGQLPLPHDDFAYTFASPSATAIVTWSMPYSAQELPTVLDVQGASRAYTIDPMGNSKPADIQDGQVLLQTGATPCMLVVEGANVQPKVLTPLVEIKPPGVAIPGEPIPVNIVAHNPTGRDQTFSLHAVGASGPAVTLPVPAGGQNETTIPLDSSSATGHAYQRMLVSAVEYELSGSPRKGELPLRIRLGTRIANGPVDEAKPDFVLDQYANVVNFNENVPQRANLTWKGPDDLSAKLWLRETSDALTVHAVVRDDVACPPKSHDQFWEGDSAQVAFTLPGFDGQWSFVGALYQGKAEAICLQAPNGLAKGGMDGVLQAKRVGTSYIYDFTFPRAMITGGKPWPDTVSFSFVANDSDDGKGREGFIELTDGLGRNNNPALYIPVAFSNGTSK